MYITYSTSLIGYIAFTYRKNPDSSEKKTQLIMRNKNPLHPHILTKKTIS